MSEIYNRFINEKLTNIDNDDMKNIIPLGEMDSLILGNIYFSETIKYALLIERTYEEPVMTSIFDESEIDSDTLKGILKSMYPNETPILIYWSIRFAIKTTWGMFIKYWDDFFYSAGDDAIIYVNQDEVYFYNEMILKKINKLKSQSEESIFDYLQKLEDNNIKKLNAIDCLFEGVSSDLQDDLYFLFQTISEGFRAIDNDEICKEYMEHCHSLIWSNTANIITTCKPYNEKSLQYLSEHLDDNKAFDKSLVDKFYEFLKK